MFATTQKCEWWPSNSVTGQSKPAVYDAIEKLESAGIVVETTGKQRNKVYEAPEILDVVQS